MSSNRLSYDKTAYASDVQRSIDPLQYAINPFFASNCDKCYPEVATSYPNNYSPISDPRIEVENSLSNRKWKADRRQPGGMNSDDFYELSNKYATQEALASCADNQETRYSLLSDPKSRYRGLSTEHLVFGALPIDPQGYVPLIGNPGLNSRQIAIDSYRKVMDANGACDKASSKCAPKKRDIWPFKEEDEDLLSPYAKI